MDPCTLKLDSMFFFWRLKKSIFLQLLNFHKVAPDFRRYDHCEFLIINLQLFYVTHRKYLKFEH